MASTEATPRRVAWSGSGYAYLMTGVAIACIVVSGVLGSIFSPDLVTGTQHEHLHIGAMVGWVFDALAIGMVAMAAQKGIRAKVSDRAPWTVLGFGVGAIWLAVMFVAIFAPVWVTGTDPTKIPVWAGLSVILGVLLTGILCSFVKTASFEPAQPEPGPVTTTPTMGPEPAAEDATTTLQRLAQLRESGVITEDEFQAKKKDLLSRI